MHLDRFEDGTRRVSNITEVQRMESDVITLQSLFEFKLDSILADRTILGSIQPTGLRPTFLSKFEKHGMELPARFFGKPPTQLSEVARGNR